MAGLGIDPPHFIRGLKRGNHSAHRISLRMLQQEANCLVRRPGGRAGLVVQVNNDLRMIILVLGQPLQQRAGRPAGRSSGPRLTRPGAGNGPGSIFTRHPGNLFVIR